MSKRTKFLLAIGVIAALVVGWQVVAYANLPNSDFEGGDGNLHVNTTGNTDWNSFSPPFWTGQTATGPLRNFRTSDVTDANGWNFFGMLDEFKGSGLNNADSIYSGGTKQIDVCPTLTTKAAPNKDDLKRVYFSTKTLASNDHLILNLGWVRVPLNSQTSSAHVAFEFNQSEEPCDPDVFPGNHTDPAGRSLVPRTVGDLLVQYDFEGGAGAPTISISRWVKDGDLDPGQDDPGPGEDPDDPDSPNPGPPFHVDCDEPSDATVHPDLFCWSLPDTLNNQQAEAAINRVALTGATNGDRLASPGPATEGGAATPEDLAPLRFGEASIDLTAAGVFGPGECANFGRVSASSRSSGNSNSSNMFDIAGPEEFDLQNCGTIKIIKQSNPRDVNQDFDFTSDIAGPQVVCSQDPDDPATTDVDESAVPPSETAQAFTLNDGLPLDDPETTEVDESAGDTPGNTQTCLNVPEGDFTVTEGDDPAGFEFGSLSCDPALPEDPEEDPPSSYGVPGVDDPETTDVNEAKQASIHLSAGDTVTCTYINNQLETTIETHQRLVPQDTATIGGTGLTGDGTVKFELLEGVIGDDTVGEEEAPETCANTEDTIVYSEDVPLDPTDTTHTVSTDNSGDPAVNGGYSIIEQLDANGDPVVQNFYWRVTYTGDETGADQQSCVETTTLAIADGGVFPPEEEPTQ